MNKLLFILIVLFAFPGGAAVTGVPGTYNTSHPRLPFPDNAYLMSLAANSTALSNYNAAANTWDSLNPGNHQQFRRLLIAYLANKAAGNTATAASQLTKIKALANLGGLWGQFYFSVNDGVGNGTLTVTSATANFQTGCGGGPCRYLSVNGVLHQITTVVDAHTVVLNPFSSTSPAPSGTGLTLVSTAGYQGYQDMEIAMAYDWIYNDLDAATRTAFLQQIEAQLLYWESTNVNTGLSPYNDQLYAHLTPSGLIAALAIYPDFDTAIPSGGTCPTKPCGTYHLNWMTNEWFNVILPVWQQVFGPDGGGWHEDWNGYQNKSGLTTWLVPSLLSWQVATGDPIFTRLNWLKNYAYQTMYLTRPDYVMEHIGDVAAPYLTGEYSISGARTCCGVALGSLNGLAEIYNDPVLRGWARLVNEETPSGPDGFEPSAWPFYAPDTNSKPAADRSSLPLSRNFPGWGVISARSGWTENDTMVTLKYGDNFWSHEHLDAGSFTIMHRGSLAIDSGNYRPGYTSLHELQYARQTIAHNALTITDSSDVYPTQLFTVNVQDSNEAKVPLANDGGQRRVGSPYNEHQEFFASLMGSPANLAAWQAASVYFDTASLLQYQSTADYTYAAVNITAAYNNSFSATSPNAANRTNRVQSAVRHLLFLPPGYVIVYDQVNATNASFQKKWLLHSINQPVVSGNRYEIRRTELITPQPYADLWTYKYRNQLSYATGSPNYQYQYDGKLVGWMVQPLGTITLVGGPGKEFWVEDPKNPGTGTNWNQCNQGQCQGGWAFLAPNIPDVMQPNNSYAPVEPGSWRLEESPGTSQAQDYFLNVMLATHASDTNVPATVTAISNATQLGATWSDNNNTYSITFPKNGVGGHITITGAKSLNVDLPSGGLAPVVTSFTATPSSVSSGQPSTLSWVVSDATSVSIDNGVGAQSNLSSGSVTVSPVTTTLYTLTASNSAGSTQAQVLVTVVISDTQPPTVPANLSATAVSSSQISLSWSASTDNVAVTGYKIFQNGAQVGTSATTSYTDNGLTAATTYSYKVSAFDAAGNNSNQSAAAVATTLPASGGGIPIPNGTWVKVLTTGIPQQADGWEKLVYASAAKKAIYFGGYHGTNEDGNQALVGYDFATNSWSVMDVAAPLHSEHMPENGHPVGMVAYNSSNGTIISYCCPGSTLDEKPDHVWWFDTIGQTGRDKFTSPTPGMIQEATATFDSDHNTFVLFGSSAGTWTYNAATNAWRQETTTGTAPASGLGMSSMTYNSADKKVYLFGGRTGYGDTATYYNDLYTYDGLTRAWSRLTPSGTPPSPRIKAGCAYDSINNIILVYGGHNDSGLSNPPAPMNDTWMYNPVTNNWKQLSPATSPPVGNSGPFERLAFDSDDNVFVLVQSGDGGYASGGTTYAAAQTWLFRYAGVGPNAGTATLGAQPTAGGINRNSDGWASEPTLAGNGSSLVLGWVEMGKPFDTTAGGWPHAYAAQLIDRSWQAMGSSYLSLDAEFSGSGESHNPSVAIIGGIPWMAWYKENTGAISSAKIFAKKWSAGSWSGSTIGLGTSVATTGDLDPRFSQGRPWIVDVNGTPHVAFLEVDRTFYPWKTFVYVKAFDGTKWNLKGSGPLNVNGTTPGATATSVCVASDGTNPYVAWTEGVNLSFTTGTATPPQVRVARWTGSAWAAIGASLNMDTTNGWASDAAIAYLNGQPYVAWTERSQAGSSQVFVKTYSSGNWVLVGSSGSLNKDTSTGWAFRPVLIADPVANALYLAWVEQQNIGQKAQTYVNKYTAGTWTSLGESLNVDSANGSAARVNLAIFGGQPVAAWGEVNLGAMRQGYVKQWNGSIWTLLTGTSTSPNTCDLNSDGAVNGTDVNLGISQALGFAACTNADLDGDGVCTIIDVQRIISASLGGACKTGR
jgi:hypothetical protein